MQTQLPFHYLLVTAMVLLGSQPSEAASSEATPAVPGFHVTGILHAAYIGPSNIVKATQTWPFSLSVQSNRWECQTTWTNGVVEHIAGDGANTIMWHESPEPLEPFPLEGVVPATVSASAFPLMGPPGTVLWMAFASTPFLDKGSPLPRPIGAARMMAGVFMVKAQVDRHPGPPRLPRRIVFRVDGSKRSEALRNPFTRLENTNPDEWYEQRRFTRERQRADGATSAIYEVLSWTNVGPFAVPSKGRLVGFRASGRWKRAQEHVFTVREARLLETPLQWPSKPRRWDIVDTRFRSWRQGIDHIFYSTNRLFPSVDDPRLVELFEQKKRSAPFVRLDIVWEWLVRGLFLVLFLAPLVVWLYRSRLIRVQRTVGNTPSTTQGEVAE